MLRVCDEPGCSTRTLGARCLAHEVPRPARRFPRGRPFRPGPEHVALAEKKIAPSVVLLEGAP